LGLDYIRQQVNQQWSRLYPNCDARRRRGKTAILNVVLSR